MIRRVEPSVSCSVLLVTYNDEPLVRQALDAIAAQTWTDAELIVIDDASSDGTVAIIRDWLAATGWPAQFLANEVNVGICANLNRGLAIASGRFVCSVSGDDWMEPDRLERQVGFFVTLPESVGLVYSDVRVWNDRGQLRSTTYVQGYLGDAPPPEGRILEGLFSMNPIPAAGAMIRRSALDAVGPYDEALLYEDYDMWLRLADAFEVRWLPGVVANWRVLPTSLSSARENHARLGLTGIATRRKWLGHSASRDAVLAARTRRTATWVASWDVAAARSALQEVQYVDDALLWRAVIAGMGVPGAGPALAGVRKAREAGRGLRSAVARRRA